MVSEWIQKELGEDSGVNEGENVEKERTRTEVRFVHGNSIPFFTKHFLKQKQSLYKGKDIVSFLEVRPNVQVNV